MEEQKRIREEEIKKLSGKVKFGFNPKNIKLEYCRVECKLPVGVDSICMLLAKVTENPVDAFDYDTTLLAAPTFLRTTRMPTMPDELAVFVLLSHLDCQLVHLFRL